MLEIQLLLEDSYLIFKNLIEQTRSLVNQQLTLLYTKSLWILTGSFEETFFSYLSGPSENYQEKVWANVCNVEHIIWGQREDLKLCQI